MHVHLPKPLHGWREFVGEVGIIVLGVLIVLGAGQIVEWVHDRQVAEDARENVRAEARLNLGFIQGRIASQHCIEARLSELSAILANAGDASPEPRPTWIAKPPTIPFFTTRWQAATASGRNSLFPAKEQEQFGMLYQIFNRYNEYQPREQEVWADLRAGDVARAAGARGSVKLRQESSTGEIPRLGFELRGNLCAENGRSDGTSVKTGTVGTGTDLLPDHNAAGRCAAPPQRSARRALNVIAAFPSR
jgi:hypothetical protein